MLNASPRNGRSSRSATRRRARARSSPRSSPTPSHGRSAGAVPPANCWPRLRLRIGSTVAPAGAAVVVAAAGARPPLAAEAAVEGALVGAADRHTIDLHHHHARPQPGDICCASGDHFVDAGTRTPPRPPRCSSPSEGGRWPALRVLRRSARARTPLAPRLRARVRWGAYRTLREVVDLTIQGRDVVGEHVDEALHLVAPPTRICCLPIPSPRPRTHGVSTSGFVPRPRPSAPSAP